MKTILPLLAIGLVFTVGCADRTQPVDDGECGTGPEAPCGERRVTQRATLELEDAGDEDMNKLKFASVEGHPVDVYVESGSPIAALVAQHRPLTYTLWLTKWETHKDSGDFFWEPQIAGIADEGKVVYDASICPLHHTPMQRGKVEITYGLPTGELIEALKTEFSGGPGFRLGGCCVESVTTTYGYRCGACIAAYTRWKTEFVKKRAGASGAK